MNTTQNIPPEIMQQAVDWLLRQQAAPFSDEELQEFQQWLQQSPQHQRAWQCAEYFKSTIQTLPTQHSEDILQKASQIHAKRIAKIGKLILLFALSASTYVVWSSNIHYRFSAEFSTKVGEQKQIKLSDGSQLYLNTNTALDTHFDQQQRLLELHYGEIQVQTVKDPQSIKRPFIVQTRHGTLEALGTVFNVKQIDDLTCVAVIESAVKVTAYHLQPVIIKENQQLCFNQNTYEPIQKMNVNQKLWQKGLFAAYDMPLSQFVHEMTRYHAGYISINKNIADLRISGAYPIQDNAKTLQILQRTYPIKVNRHLKDYVISIQPQRP